MALCASCGLQLIGRDELCSHHACAYGADWATGNRIMCAFFHRKQEPERLGPVERDDAFFAYTGEVG